MAAPPFRVKAIYAYSSEHSDDLNFPQDTIITVTELEDDDWYVGEYISAEGETKSGLFPKNFVEHYEPAPPPRPTRAARPKPAESPAVQTPASPTVSKPKTEEADSSRQNIDALASSTPAEEPVPVIPAPKPAPAPAPSEAPAQPPAAPKLEAAQPAKKPPPPIAEKSSSFKDRLAAFNKQGAAPIAPFKPGGSAPSTFIRKPFVAPPPSRNSYVPPVNREPAPQKIYRREEDPEIAQRKAEDEEAAEKAGLTAHAQPEAAEGNEDAPKPVSLKERIALLQKQQQEAAARRAGETVQKKKPERPVKKRVESHDGQEASRASIDQPEGERATRDSSDIPREAPVRKASKPPAIPREREVSDGNEADQSAAGETTEDNEHDSSTEEEPEPMRHPKALTAEPDAVEEEDETEEGEEEEIDEEERRQLALRERMAKLSGGMGMGAMFGGPPGGMAMPGMGGAPAPRKKPTLQRKHTEEAEEPPTRAPMVPIPGMGLPGLTRSMSSESGVTVGKEDEGHPIKSERAADEVPDIEEVKHASQTERHAPPPPPHERTVPQSPQSTERGVPPPIPGGRPSLDARPVPPRPTAQQLQSESEGSESDDEMLPSATELPIRGAPPPLPSHASQLPARTSIDSPTLPQSPTSQSDKRASRLPPPIPIASPTMAPGPSSARGPPPLPTQAPPIRQATGDSMHRKALGAVGASEDGSEYEGDYDTDIASGVKHKDALKAHGRDPSLDESITIDTPVRSPHLLQRNFSPTGPRAVPPLPPSGPPTNSRKSGEYSKAAPPPIPLSPIDGDYDPFNYSGAPPAVAARSPPPPPTAPAHRLPPLPPSAAPAMPAPSTRQEEDSEDSGEDEDLYAQPSPRKSTEQPRKSMDRPPPPLPPQAASSHDRAAPPLPPQAPPAHAHFDTPRAPSNKAPVRPSFDQERSFASPSRTSTDPIGRPSMSGHRPEGGDFIARDIDLAEGSLWWTQPNTPPPVTQGRPDVGFEMEESTNSKRGGKTIVSRDVYILYQDYSQTVVTSRFDAHQPQDVQLEQRHEPPPNKLRQDQLENWWTRYGASIAKTVEKSVGASAIGDGTAHSFILDLLKNLPGSLAPVGTRAYGALVYANLGNATVQQFDEIRSGDVVSFRNAKFQGKHGGLHTKYSLDVVGHVGVVVEWDGTKKKLRVAEQGRDVKEKKKDKKGKVEVESYRLEDLRSGEVRVWRVVGRDFVGWDTQ